MRTHNSGVTFEHRCFLAHLYSVYVKGEKTAVSMLKILGYAVQNLVDWDLCFLELRN